MRILMLSQFYPPIIGGIERHVKNLSDELAARGHQVSVVTLWHRGQPQVEMDGAVRVYRVRGTAQRLGALFTSDRQHSPPLPDPEVTLSLRRVLAQEKPHVVHAHNWIVHSFLPLKAWSGAKLVMTLHDNEMTCVQMRWMHMDRELCSGPGPAKCLRCAIHHYGWVKGPVTLGSNWAMGPAERRLVDMFLPVSRAVAETNGLTRGRSPFSVVPNFVPDDVATPPRTQDEMDPRLVTLPSEGFILQVGDLSQDKGVGVLLEAYARLDAPPPFVFVGRRLPETPGVLPAGISVMEGMDHASVMETWRRSLFGTVASTCLDACPTVTMEAMACGRPVVASRIGGIVDQVVDGETGLLVPPGDAAALRQAMQRLIADPELCAQMGRAAKRRVVEFQASRVVTTIEGIYDRLLRSGHAAGPARSEAGVGVGGAK